QQALERIIAAGQSITVVNPASSYVAGPLKSAAVQPTVAWLVFSPYQMNQINFSQQLSVYATVTVPAPPAVIMMNSKAKAAPGTGYKFTNGYFQGDAGSGNSYTVNNQMDGYNLYFGLAQSAEINGKQATSPLNAIAVLQGQQAMLKPLGQISIFL